MTHPSRTRRGRLTAFCLGLVGILCTSTASAQETPTRFDLVITGGRVMDPESGLDAVRSIGIAAGVVRAISESALEGDTVIDARGLVVAPGFIDLHHHSFRAEALRSKVLDGVTAAFEMELGVPDIDAWYADLEGRSPIHFGAAAGHPAIRMQVLTDSTAVIPAGEGATRLASSDEIAEIRRRVEHELGRGAVGVGMGIEYTPGATPWEVLEMFRAAARFPGAPVHVHVRGTDEPQFWMETAELFLAAVVTGAPLQIVHANSSFGGDAPKLFEMIAAARARGLDVTTETYPYTASMTRIDSAPFDDWESWPDERFDRFVWPSTGERLTRATFDERRKQGGVVVIEGMSEEKLLPTLTSPLPMIVSDGVAEADGAHPRAAGTYARVLGRYVREQGALTLMEALRKMTLLPARRLEGRVPAMRAKGRIRVGSDADLTLFDPLTVIDRATYDEPTRPSAGIRHVLVDGVLVVRDGVLQQAVHPGRAVRAGGSAQQLLALPPTDHVDRLAREPMLAETADGTLYVSGYGGDSPRLWRSADGGRTWSSVDIGTAADGAIGNSDVDLAVAPDGTLYFVTMSYDREKYEGTGISIAASRDGGMTWNWTALSRDRFDDRPWVEVAPDGAAHVVWNDGAGVAHAVSTDRGVTWVERPRVHDVGGSSHFAIGPTGALAVRITPLSASANRFDPGVDHVAVSRDAGASWALHDLPGNRAWSAFDLNADFLRWVEPVAWDSVGRLYALWSEGTTLVLGRSADYGASWTSAQVAEDSMPVYFPYLVARGDGELVATWFSGLRDSIRANVAHIAAAGGDDAPRVTAAGAFEVPAFLPPDSTGARLRDTAGEYMPVTFLRDGRIAVVTTIQDFVSQTFGFTFRPFALHGAQRTGRDAP